MKQQFLKMSIKSRQKSWSVQKQTLKYKQALLSIGKMFQKIRTLTLTVLSLVQICTFNFESLYRVLNGFLGGWGCHDFIRIVVIFNFQPFLGLKSIKNIIFIIIMCLHSPLHTCRANFTNPAFQKTKGTIKSKKKIVWKFPNLGGGGGRGSDTGKFPNNFKVCRMVQFVQKCKEFFFRFLGVVHHHLSKIV